MTHYIYNMGPWDFISLGVIFLFGLAIVILAVWARGLTKELEDQTRKMISMVKWQDKLEDNIDGQLEKTTQKETIIQDLLHASNTASAAWDHQQSTYKAEIDRLKEILSRVHPYSRLYLHDPAKLEAWLTRLKAPKKRKGTKL